MAAVLAVTRTAFPDAEAVTICVSVALELMTLAKVL